MGLGRCVRACKALLVVQSARAIESEFNPTQFSGNITKG